MFNLIKMALIQLNTNDPANIYHAQTLMRRRARTHDIMVCRLNVIVLSGIVPGLCTTFKIPKLSVDSKTKGRDIPGVAFN